MDLKTTQKGEDMATRTKMSDLNNVLFEMMERLRDDEISGEALEEELKRSNAVDKIAGRILEVADLSLKAAKFKAEFGVQDVPDMLTEKKDV